MRGLFRLARRIAFALIWIAALYGAAGLIGGALPANGDRTPPARGIAIYVEDNGIHTGLVLPVVAAGIDWRRYAAPGAIRDARYSAHGWRAFGWGDRDFYLNTPRWADVRPAIVLAAAVGSGSSVMHVEAVGEPATSDRVRRVLLTEVEYRRLAAQVAASFAPGPSLYGYTDNDAFYPAQGRYSALITCNAWTGAMLRAAGVRMGRWTPFPVTVMWWL